MKKYLWMFLLSMVPIIELRGAIPAGCASGFPWWETLIICIIGNCIPVPFILIFIRQILKFMKKVKHLDKIALWVEKKANKNTDKVLKYASLGLFVFVAIPLPGTGAWTGALVASFLNMRMKYALPSIFAGVAVAGLIMTLASYGLVSAFSFIIQ